MVYLDQVVHMFIVFVIVEVQLSQSYSCSSPCPNAKGHVMNCVLNKTGNLLAEKRTISQLQCFDECLRQLGCSAYNYKQQQQDSCQLFGGLWSFDDEALQEQNFTVFAWLRRDEYNKWTKPTCLDNTCQVVNPSSNGYCQKPLDIAFLLDTSTQNAGEFNLTKNFILNVLQKFKQSPQYTKVGLINYNTNASITFSFNNFTASSHFTKFLSSIEHEKGMTRYDRALHKAEQELFSSQGGARPFVHKVVVLITDNKLKVDAQDVYSLGTLKESLKKKCIQLFAVGIGINGQNVALNVADSKDGHLLQVDLFKQLDGHSEQFAEKICAALP